MISSAHLVQARGWPLTAKAAQAGVVRDRLGYNCSSRASRDGATGTFDRDDVSLTIERSETSHRATSGGGSKLAPSFDVSQFEKEAQRTQHLEELCEVVIVLKKNCTPQVIECLLMYTHFPLLKSSWFRLRHASRRYIAYAGLQFDVKKTPYGRYVVLIYASVEWFDRASEQLGVVYERHPPRVTLKHQKSAPDAGPFDALAHMDVKYMHDIWSRFKRGQFSGNGGHMTHSRWRQYVLFSMLSAPVLDTCESIEGEVDRPITGVGINRFIRLGHVKSIIAKHSAKEADDVIEKFKLLTSPFQAADAIRDYCGEEVAFLFHFLAFLQYWLVLPAACGGLLSCYLLYLFFQSSDNKDGNNMFISRSALASAYGIAFMLYMSLLAEQWKRHSNDLCFRWGTTHADSQSKTRPWFQSSTKVYDQFSDKDVYVVSLSRRLGCVVMSIIALMPIIACTVLAHMGIFTWIYRLNFHEVFVVNLCGDTANKERFACLPGDEIKTRMIAGSFFCGLVVAVQSKITKIVAEKLTNFENYQTYSEADKALLYKVLPVEYISHFFPLFYIAFVVRNMNNLFQCGFWLFVFTYAIKYLISIIDVFVQYLWRRSRGLLNLGASNTDIPLRDLILYEALGTFAGGFKSRSVDILASVGTLPLFDHMLQVVMQVSYASVFALSFPAGSFVCLVIVFFQSRILASKVLITGARHIPRASNGIGMWLHTLEVVFFISIIINGLICTVSSEVMSGIVFNFCRGSSQSNYWQKVCVTFCELRLTNVSVPAGCTYAQTNAPICSCFDPIAFVSGKYGPPTTLNASGPGSTELWAFMLYEHIVVVLKFFLMGSFPRVSKYVSDMARAQQLYLQVNAMNEPAPLGNLDDNDAYDGDVTDAQTKQHFYVIQYLDAHSKETADAIRAKCDQPDSFLTIPSEESSL